MIPRTATFCFVLLAAVGGVQWPALAVAGQSQGGGHAYTLGKLNPVARVLMFGSPKDYSFYFRAPAKGFDAHTQTPLKRFFAYNHVRDDGNGCTHEQQRQILRQIGLLDLGVADVDRGQPPYGHAHVLYTDADPGPAQKFHPAVLNGRLPGNRPVWTYLLTEPIE